MAATTHSAQRAPLDMLESTNPATGEVVGAVPIASADDVEQAVTRARVASVEWGALSHAQRRAELEAFRRQLAQDADDLATLIHQENGKPRFEAILEVMGSLNHLAHAAQRAEKAMAEKKVSPGLMANYRATITHHPLGVIGVIGPWNYPMFTPMGSIAYALATGNAVVFKPSELTPLIGARLAATAAKTISIPNVLQVVTGLGATGAALARSAVDKVAFTGSTATGRKVMAAAAERPTPVLLELGGKDAMIVAEDANVDKAAEAAVYGALTNSGQACISIERIYAVDAIYDRFVDKVVSEVAALRAGADAGPDAEIGAMTSASQVEIVRDHIEDAVARGATVRAGGTEGITGNFIKPTVLTEVTDDMKVMREETFGPVIAITKVRNADDALRRANESQYGLGSAVFAGKNARQLADGIRAGMTAVNSVMAFSGISSLPFGGVGESGFGRIHGDEGLREFCRVKATAEERFALPMAFLSFKQPKNAYDRIKGMIVQIYGGGPVDRASAVIHRITDRLK